MNVKHVTMMLLAGAALLGLLLITGASVGNALLLAIVLACPLMMLFMMAGGHGRQGREPLIIEHLAMPMTRPTLTGMTSELVSRWSQRLRLATEW